MLRDLLRVGGKFAFVHDVTVVIDCAEIDGASRDIQPDKMALGHAEFPSNQGPALLITNLQAVL